MADKAEPFEPDPGNAGEGTGSLSAPELLPGFPFLLKNMETLRE
jgi:hypothetical protein